MTYDLVVRSRRTVLPDGERPAAVGVRDGRIAAVAAYDAPLTAREDVELADRALLPGLVDSHVHVNEPGRTEWEGFATATRAAAAGGVTTIVDMPLNSLPPTVTADALAVKRAAAEGRCAVDVGFWGGAVPGNRAELRTLHDAGVYGFKCFLSPSGVEEFPELDDAGLREAMTEIAGFGGLLIAHAEDPGHLSEPDGPGYAEFLASRPPGAEAAAIARVARLAAETGCRAHIVHLSDAESLPLLAGWRARGARISAETCPHYLTLTAEQVPDGGTEFKCCPPIRDAENREGLWRGLADGSIGCVVSDHSPCAPELKKGGFDTAWGGISSLQLGLPVIWTAARARGHDLCDVARWMAGGPAELTGLTGKGRVEEGYDADLVVFAPDREFVVDPGALRQRHPVTPYAGMSLTGVVERVWLRGEPAGHGRLLRRRP
ncbi:allantoinase AllB [Actinoallomurus iriomotensis]|uniref:allantoinase n=1 Tax=Actinoallomurus iriomotensis TaxID=478107 RepID=A0A9W6VRG7_9ACTN|nr:allantoinase AllB [Actinoallomurus iriomotensis]GLY82238.1 allantoinase [Actinoallomurus iriomotensis]